MDEILWNLRDHIVGPNDVIAQIPQDLIHLEDRRQSFYQYRGFDGAARQLQ
jgi:hypothetical protein